MSFPTITFNLNKEAQPSSSEWKELERFVASWNAARETKFELNENGWWLYFQEGMNAEELVPLNLALNEIAQKHDIRWSGGIQDLRERMDYLICPFILLEGAIVYDDGFYVNYDQYMALSTECEVCGFSIDASSRITVQPIIDESYFLQRNDTNSRFNGPPDFIHIGGGSMIVSTRVIDVLKKAGIDDYIVNPVQSLHSKKPSENYVFLSAKQSIVEPCYEHTPRIENAICSNCGSESDSIFGHFHVQSVQLRGCKIFSKNRFGGSHLYFSRELVLLFFDKGLTGISINYGLETCEH